MESRECEIRRRSKLVDRIALDFEVCGSFESL
jgi:hypothetical protein